MNIPIRQYWALLVSYLRPQKPRVALLAALLLGGIGLQLANPQILRYFIDTAQQPGSQDRLTTAALLFIGLALVQQLVSILATYVGETVGWTATNALRHDLAVHCLRLDMPFHTAHTPGELIERIDGDVTALANFFSQFAIRLAGNVLLLAGVLLLLLREDWRICLAFAALSCVVLITLSRLRDLAAGHWAAGRRVSADLAGFLEERLAGTEDIRSSGATAYTLRRLHMLMRELMLAYRKARTTGQLVAVSTKFLLVLGLAAGLGLGAYLYMRGAITIGTVYLISYYAGILAMPLEQIMAQVQDLQQASASIKRVDALYRTQPTIADGPGVELPAGPLSVEFQEVSFSYAAGAPVLRDISFQVQPGQVLGLLGRTGSGKTTITRLLFRLYDPTAGTIRVGGADLRAGRLHDLRQRIGLVTQDVQPFRATVRDNLTLFDHGIGDEQILQAIATLGLLPWYRSLPAGLDTVLLSGGQGVSAGEAQLLAFTRVFLKNPSVVILDEASSRLDPLTERLIERAVDALLADRTGIIIAHRLATVQRADTILILEHGRIVEHGAREALALDQRSRFYGLLQTGLEEILA